MITRLLAGLALLLACSCSSGPQQAVDTIIESVSVVDVEAGRIAWPRDVVIDKGAIVSVGWTSREYRAARTIDGRGKYLMPGLWDMHVHFGGGEGLIEENRNLLPLYLAHGITSVRDAAGDLSAAVLRWRDEVAAGTLVGPTIYTSGPKIEGIASIWPGDLEVGSEAEVRTALDALAAMRVDFIKITDNTLRPELYLFAIRDAAPRGFRTSAHVPMALTIDQVSEAGLGTIEHLSYLVRAGSPRERELTAAVAAGRLAPADALTAMIDSFEERTALAAFERLAARGTAVVPTANGSRILAYLDREDHRGDEYLKYVGRGLQATYQGRVERAARDDAAAIARRHARYEKSVALLPLLRRAGVTIIAGTDAGFLNSFNYPGIGLHDELELYVRAGLTPVDALRASVVNGPAFFSKQSRFGAVAPGKVADLLLLEADPLSDIRATRAIAGVMARGVYHDRMALDAVLRDVQARAAATDPANYRAAPVFR